MVLRDLLARAPAFHGVEARLRVVVRAGAALLLLVLAGCGSAAPRTDGPAPGGNVRLEALCPGVHQVYDGLVASNPTSQADFVVHLEDLRAVADRAARTALAPLINAAKGLAAAGRGAGFDTAQDAVYRAVVGLDASCRKAGSFILH